MKFSIQAWPKAVLVSGLCLASALKLTAQGEGSLKNSNIELSEARLALETAVADNQRLKEKLAASEASIAALQKNLAAVSAEAEVFRRKATELNVRLEALGTGKLDDRLIKLLNDLKVSDDECRQLREGLLNLAEAALRFQNGSITEDAEAILQLEAGMRGASKALGVAPKSAPEAGAVPSTLIDGQIISIQEELALIVANLGSKQGVKVGMPFEVYRGDDLIGAVRVVDVREKIAGALIQNLSDKAKIKLGDRLKVAAQH